MYCLTNAIEQNTAGSSDKLTCCSVHKLDVGEIWLIERVVKEWGGKREREKKRPSCSDQAERIHSLVLCPLLGSSQTAVGEKTSKKRRSTHPPSVALQLINCS